MNNKLGVTNYLRASAYCTIALRNAFMSASSCLESDFFDDVVVVLGLVVVGCDVVVVVVVVVCVVGTTVPLDCDPVVCGDSDNT